MPNYHLELADLNTLADYRRVVEAIDMVLCSEAEPEPDIVETVHDKLRQAIRNVNDRLRQCDELLVKGLRAEAIQRSQADPDLLQLFTVLDFPDFDAWNDLAVSYGLQIVPELLVDAAGELNDAFSAQEPLSELMYAHRVHALARSPLPIRMDIMRRLAKVDGKNPVWADDLRTFEKTRLKQIREQLQAAAQQESLEVVSDLRDELTQTDWSVKVSPALTKRADGFYAALQRKQARSELEKLEPQLRDAHAALNIVAGRDLREQWNSYAAVAELPFDDAVLQAATPALNWLANADRQEADQSQFNAALAALERSLASQADRMELHARYQAVLDCQLGVPPDVEERLQQRLDELDREDAARTKRMWILGVSAAVILLAAIGTGVYFYLRSVELSTQVTSLQAHLEKKELDQAQQQLASLKKSGNWTYSHPAIQQLKGQVEEAVKDEEKRKNKFADALASARSLALKQPTLEDPQMENFDKAYKILEDAYNEIADTDDERDTVQALVDEIRAAQEKLQKQVDDQFLAVAKQFQTDVAALGPAMQDYLKALQAKRLELDSLKARPYITPSVHTERIRQLESLIDGKIREEEAVMAEDAAFTKMKNAVGNVDTFRTAMQRYLDDERFATRKRHKDFEQILQAEATLWAGCEAWNQFIDRYSGTDLISVDEDRATQIVTAAKTLQSQYAGFPSSDRVTQLMKTLSFLSGNQRATAIRTLESLFKSPCIGSAYWIRSMKTDAEGNRIVYYSLKIPQPVNVGMPQRWQFFQVMDLKVPKKPNQQERTFADNEIDNDRTPTGFVWTAPQSVFAENTRQTLDTLDSTDWETTFIKILQDLEKNRDIDLFLKLHLTFKIQECAMLGSDFFTDVLKEDYQILRDASGQLDPETNWLLPEDEKAMDARRQSKRALAKLQPVDELPEKLVAYQKAMRDYDLGPRYRWVGILHRDGDDRWTCSFGPNTPPNQSSQLFVLIRPMPTKGPNFVPVGTVLNGQATVSPTQTSLILVEGRPVFTLDAK